MCTFLRHSAFSRILDNLDSAVYQIHREQRGISIRYLVFCWHRDNNVVTVGICTQPAFLVNTLRSSEFNCQRGIKNRTQTSIWIFGS